MGSVLNVDFAPVAALLDGGVVTVVTQGRHRYYRLRGSDVAQVIEALGADLTVRVIELGWFERGTTRRALAVTDAGRTGLADAFGCVLA